MLQIGGFRVSDEFMHHTVRMPVTGAMRRSTHRFAA
jgi:hypothetical protein